MGHPNCVVLYNIPLWLGKHPKKTLKKPASTREALLGMIEQYLAANPKVTPEAFGWAAIKDSKLVPRLRNAGDITTGKLDATLKYLSQFQQRSKSDD